ncbi:MAG: class I SAM-dependent methyltransferase [Rhodoglobus sp.]
MRDSDSVFSGSVPQRYEQLMVPMLFGPYAEDLARRVAALHPSSVLETAAGTGVVTRELGLLLPVDVRLVATDLNQGMLDVAEQLGVQHPVSWQQADALDLPFDDESFDVVVCQFGVMFFPDRARGFAEALRVLRPGGWFLFNAWDSIEHSEFEYIVQQAMVELFPDDPPLFLERTPHGYHDVAVIRADLAFAGFLGEVRVESLTKRTRAADARAAAGALTEGSPLRAEIEQRSPDGLAAATAAATEAIAARFGDGPVEGQMRAHVVAAQKN